jgi:hypothetical protein
MPRVLARAPDFAVLYCDASNLTQDHWFQAWRRTLPTTAAPPDDNLRALRRKNPVRLNKRVAISILCIG